MHRSIFLCLWTSLSLRVCAFRSTSWSGPSNANAIAPSTSRSARCWLRVNHAQAVPRSRTTTTPTIELGSHVDVGCSNIAGTDPDRPQKVNQDAHFVFQMKKQQTTDKKEEDAGDAITVAGVMDGHGLKGHLVTQFLVKQLPLRIKECYDPLQKTKIHHPPSSYDKEFQIMLRNLCELGGNANPKHVHVPPPNEEGFLLRVLIDSFHASHLDARLDPNVPAGRSGTTCVVCAMDESARKLYVANVGDSRAILGYRRALSPCPTTTTTTTTNHHPTTAPPTNHTTTTTSTATLSKQQKLVIVPLTRECTTQLPEERQRIEQSEGRIDATGNVFYGPVGIAMTRALGDSVMLRAGVIPTPDCFVLDLPTEQSLDRHHHQQQSSPATIIVLGSDGIFDVLSNQQVVRIVEQTLAVTGSVQSAADALTKEARQAWLADLPVEVKVDDITCVVITC